VSGRLHGPAALTPGKETTLHIGCEAGWTPESVHTMWRRENSWLFRDSNSDPSVVQPIVSSYTDCAIPATPSYTAQQLILTVIIHIYIYTRNFVNERRKLWSMYSLISAASHPTSRYIFNNFRWINHNVGNLCLVSLQFKSQPHYWLFSSMVSMTFFTLSVSILELYLKICHDNLLLNSHHSLLPSNLIRHCSWKT
jgi:hypothetical protein